MRVRTARAPERDDGQVGQKKLKQPSFAAAVDRADLVRGAQELGVDFDEHITFVIAALAEQSDELIPA